MLTPLGITAPGVRGECCPREGGCPEAGRSGGEVAGVGEGGDQGHAAQLPVVGEGGGAQQRHQVERPQVGVGQEPSDRLSL